MGPQNIASIRRNEWPIFVIDLNLFSSIFFFLHQQKNQSWTLHIQRKDALVFARLFKVKFFLGLGFRGSSCSLTSFFSIFRGGVDLDFAKVIVLAMYLGSWRFVVPINTSKFLQESHSFLSGPTRANNSSSCPFQAHFRWVHDLLLSTIQIFIASFGQLSEKKANKKTFQEICITFISKVVFRLSWCLSMTLCRPKLGCLAFYPLSHPIF